MAADSASASPIVSHPDQRHRRLGRSLGWLVGVAALAAVVVVVTHISEPRDFVRLVERAEPWWLAVAFGVQAATYVALAQVWRAVARVARQRLPLGTAVRIALAKLFVDQTLPSVGISGGVLLASALGRRGMTQRTVSATIVVDLASYYFAYAASLAIAIAIAGAAGHVGPMVIASALVFVAIAIGIALAIIALSRTTRRMPNLPGVRRAKRWLATADRRLTGDVRLLARAAAWQAAIVALDGATTWTLLRAVGVDAPVAGVFASFMIASLARTLSIVPAGLGVFEGIAVITLHGLGIPVAAALSATLLFRGLSYWLPMIPGFIASRGLR
jgi:Mg2+-importing ATPase